MFRVSPPPHANSFSQFSTIHFVCPHSLSWCVNECQAVPWSVVRRFRGNGKMWALKSGVFVAFVTRRPGKRAFHHRSALLSKPAWRKRLQLSGLCTESLLLCFPSKFLMPEIPHAKRESAFYSGSLKISIEYFFKSTRFHFFVLLLFKHQCWDLLHLDQILVEFYIRITILQVKTQIFQMTSFDLLFKLFSSFHDSVLV